MTVGGRALNGVGIVSSGSDGIALTGPESDSPISFQGLLDRAGRRSGRRDGLGDGQRRPPIRPGT